MISISKLFRKVNDMRATLTTKDNPPAQELPFPVFYTENGHEYPGVARKVEQFQDAIGRVITQVFIEYFFVPEGEIIPRITTGWVMPENLEVLA